MQPRIPPALVELQKPQDQFSTFQPTGFRDTYAVEPVHSPAAKTAKVTVRKLNNATKGIVLRRETTLNIRKYETKPI